MPQKIVHCCRLKFPDSDGASSNSPGITNKVTLTPRHVSKSAHRIMVVAPMFAQALCHAKLVVQAVFVDGFCLRELGSCGVHFACMVGEPSRPVLNTGHF